MNLESIYLALSESYRKALIAFVACTLIVYPLLYFGLPSFQSLEWYTQDSNHADPALPVANPVILVACRAPCSPQSHIPCRRHNLGLGSIIFIHI